MNNEADGLRINETIRKLEYNLQQENDVNMAYQTFTSLFVDIMEKKLPKHKTNVQSSRPKSKSKPFWYDELQSAWDQVRVKERSGLREISPRNVGLDLLTFKREKPLIY